MKLASVVFALAVVAAGVLTVRLNMGPVVIDGLGQRIAGALHDKFGRGMQFTLGKTSLLQSGFGPSLSVDGLSVVGADGQLILSAPRAEVSIDPFALMVGRVVPRRLEVLGVTLKLLLQPDGHLAVAAADESKPIYESERVGGEPATEASEVERSPEPAPGTRDGAAAPRRAVVMKKAASAIRQALDVLTNPKSAIAAVDRLGVSKGTLVIEDRKSGREVAYKGLDLTFDKAHGVSTFSVAADGPSRRWSLTAVASGQPRAERHFALKAQDVSVDEMGLAAGGRPLGFDSDMPFGAHFALGLKPDDTLSEASGGFEAGPGFLKFDDPDDEPKFVTKIEGGFHWDGATRQIKIDPTRYVEGETRIEVGGTVTPPTNEGEPWTIAIGTTEPGLLAPDRLGQAPAPIESGHLDGRLLPDQKRFVLDRLALKMKEGGAAAAGEIDWVNGPHIRLGAAMDPTPVAVVERVWPSFMASAVRGWIITHFESGTLSNATLQIDYDRNALLRMRSDRAPPDKDVAIEFKVTDARLRYLDGVPPLENVEGAGHITGRTSRFVVTSGMTKAEAQTLTLSNGVFLVPNTNRHPTPAVLSAHLAGPVEAVANILSRDALKPYASVPLDPSTLHGNVDGTLERTLTLGTGADKTKGTLRVAAHVTDFVADRLVGKESLQDATLDIGVGNGALKAAGRGRIFGGPASFEINRVGTEAPTAAINVVLDDAAREKLGLATVPGIAGPVTAKVNATLGDPAKMKAQVDLDLGKASVVAPVLGLSKPAGRPAKIGFTLASGADKMLIDPIAIDVGNLQAKGSLDIGADNAFKSAHFSSFKASPGDDMRLDVTKNEDTFKVTIRGSTIDARPFLKALTSTPTNERTQISRTAKAEKKETDSFKEFDVDLKSAILTGFNKEVMTGVDLKLSKHGPLIRQFAVQGRFGRETVSGSMGANQRMRVATEDAGALVSFIDLYKHMEGGQLSADMQVGDDTLTGDLEIHDFILRDEPAIRRLVATSDTVSASRGTEGGRHINAGAVGFKRLKVNFEREGSRLDLHDATMFGSDIGLSVDGWLDYSHDRVSMKGTFVPAYAVNNLFSQIPVFGLLLGGKSNEGLFAISFNISGQLSSPALGINPLSSIAPGFLRGIFGVLDTPNEAAPPSR